MKTLYKITVSNKFIQGGFIFTLSNFAIGFINYLFSILAGRALGPAGYGEITTLFSYLGFVSIPMSILGTLLIQKMGQTRDVNEYVLKTHNWMYRKIQRWWGILFVILAVSPFVSPITNLSHTTGLALPVLVIIAALNTFYSGALQGMHLFIWVSIIGTVGALIKLSGSVSALSGFAKLEGIMIMLVCSALFQLIASRIIVLRHVPKSTKTLTIFTKRFRDLLSDRQLWYTTFASGVLILLANVDMMVVKRIFSAEDAGLFGAWSLFAKIFLYVVGPLLGLAYIYFADKKQERHHHLVGFGSILVLLVASIVFNFAYGWYGRFIIESLFSTKFSHVLPFIEWAGYYGTTYVFLTFFMQYYLAKKQAITMVPGFLFPLYALALLFIPKSIADVMQLNMIYALTCVCVFLLYFGQERLTYLKSLFIEA